MSNNMYLSLSTKRSLHHSIIFYLLLQHNREEYHYLGGSCPHKIIKDKLDYQINDDSICISPYFYHYMPEFENLLQESLNKDIIINNEGNTSSKIEENKRYIPINSICSINNIQTIIIVRDCYNCFASCWNLGDLKYHMNEIKESWKSHVREIIEDTNFITNAYGIYANVWVISKEYRRQICKDLGLFFTDKGINRVSNNANGSSFDQLRYNGKAQEMNIFNRYQRFMHDENFRKVIDDEELGQLQRELDRKFAG